MRYFSRVIIFLFLGLLISQVSFAQLSSKNAIGARFGSATGINYRYSLSDQRAVEGILTVQSNSVFSRFRLIGLYEYHKPLGQNFSWYYGFGASVGSYKMKAFVDASGHHYDPKSEFAMSIEGIVGVEYSIPSSPISVSFDAKPYLDFIQESSIKFVDPFGLSIRYKF